MFHVVTVTPMLISEFKLVYSKFDVHDDLCDVISEQKEQVTRWNVFQDTFANPVCQFLFCPLGNSYMDLHMSIASSTKYFVVG